MPSSDAAVVNGEHITQADLDRRLSEAKCSYQLQKRTFPKAGSQEYQAVQQQVLQNFVQRIQLQQKAPSLSVSVSDKQVEDQLASLKKQYFGGSEKKYAAELKKQCVTDKEVRDDIRANILSNAIFNKVTAGAVVTAAQVKSYYDGTARSTRARRRASSATSWSRTRRSRTSSTTSSREAPASPRSPRSTRPTPARSRRADS